jgi:hypothetical protein
LKDVGQNKRARLVQKQTVATTVVKPCPPSSASITIAVVYQSKRRIGAVPKNLKALAFQIQQEAKMTHLMTAVPSSLEIRHEDGSAHLEFTRIASPSRSPVKILKDIMLRKSPMRSKKLNFDDASDAVCFGNDDDCVPFVKRETKYNKTESTLQWSLGKGGSSVVPETEITFEKTPERSVSQFESSLFEKAWNNEKRANYDDDLTDIMESEEFAVHPPVLITPTKERSCDSSPERMVHQPTAAAVVSGSIPPPPSPLKSLQHSFQNGIKNVMTSPKKSKPTNSNHAMVKIFVLLLQPSTKFFEIIQLVYPPSVGTTVGDLIDLIPDNATALKDQSYIGFTRPKKRSVPYTDRTLLVESQEDQDSVGVEPGEIIVAIPFGAEHAHIVRLSKTILANPRVHKLLQRTNPLRLKKRKKKTTPRSAVPMEKLDEQLQLCEESMRRAVQLAQYDNEQISNTQIELVAPPVVPSPCATKSVGQLDAFFNKSINTSSFHVIRGHVDASVTDSISTTASSCNSSVQSSYTTWSQSVDATFRKTSNLSPPPMLIPSPQPTTTTTTRRAHNPYLTLNCPTADKNQTLRACLLAFLIVVVTYYCTGAVDAVAIQNASLQWQGGIVSALFFAGLDKAQRRYKKSLRVTQRW